jgi:hypothetical protein
VGVRQTERKDLPVMTTMALMSDADLLDEIPVNAPGGDPSPAQAKLMGTLITELLDLDRDAYLQAVDYTKRMEGRWTPGREGNASRWIDRLIAKLAELRTAARRPTPAKGGEELADGTYVLDGSIYKVRHAVHGSGRQYASLLVPPVQEGADATWEYKGQAPLRQLTAEHLLTAELAKQYGALYGVCVRCGRVLTREDSIERMMGSTCYGKSGF